MPTLNTYDTGDLVRCSGEFTNSAGTAIDPTAVLFKFRNPASTITTYTYGIDAEVVKTATGNYYVDIDAATSGTYYYRFYATGTGQSAEEHRFIVRASRVVVT
jgi:hypothetical protein